MSLSLPHTSTLTTDTELCDNQEEDMKRDMLSQLLLPEARERLSRIQLVRPQRAEQITGLLARMAQAGQLRGRVTEEQLVDVLNQVEAMEEGRAPGTQGGGQGSKIVVGSMRPPCHIRTALTHCELMIAV